MAQLAKLRCIVCGGGLGGMGAALALAKAGHQVDLFEVRSEAVEVGAGISVPYNGSLALKAMGIDVMDPKSFWAAQDYIAYLDCYTGQEWARFNYESADKIYQSRVVLAERGAILRQLETHAIAAGVRLHYGCKAASVTQTPGSACLRLTDGQEFPCDLLIGADGVFSTVRRQVAGEVPVKNANVTCIRAVLKWHPTHAAASSASGQHFWLLPGGVRLHATTMKREGDRGKNEDCDSYLLWTQLSDPGGIAKSADEAARYMKQYLNEHPGLCRDVINLVNTLVQTPELIIVKELVELENHANARYVFDRVVLLGDSAHAMQIFAGQGACQAWEDAVCLVQCIDRFPLAEALRKYEEIRRPHNAMVAEKSATIGWLTHARSAVGRWAMWAAFRSVMDRQVKTNDPIWRGRFNIDTLQK